MTSTRGGSIAHFAAILFTGASVIVDVHPVRQFVLRDCRLQASSDLTSIRAEDFDDPESNFFTMSVGFGTYVSAEATVPHAVLSEEVARGVDVVL